jgi:hypothetical protein
MHADTISKLLEFLTTFFVILAVKLFKYVKFPPRRKEEYDDHFRQEFC